MRNMFLADSANDLSEHDKDCEGLEVIFPSGGFFERLGVLR